MGFKVQVLGFMGFGGQGFRVLRLGFAPGLAVWVDNLWDLASQVLQNVGFSGLRFIALCFMKGSRVRAGRSYCRIYRGL